VDQNIIELVELKKQYGSFTAVDNLNLTIKKGEVFGLLGPNGAGKSTTILMMLGLTEPTSGSVKVCGINSTTNPIEVKRKVGYLPEDVGFYDDLTGLENLMFTARLNRFPGREAEQKATQLLAKVGLTQAASKKASKYSRGMRQRLGLADVLIKDPEVIILDEPTLGIDPTGVREFLDLIVELSKEKGHTVLLSSHHLHQVQQVCDRVGLFVSGKLLAEGDIKTLSEKLFTNSPYIVEAGVVYPYHNNPDTPGNNTETWLSGLLSSLKDVTAIKQKNEIFQIECTQDLTTEIARLIIGAGAGLTYLNRKEFGLDDIYYRYFEGEEGHE
jgi:ABC-2 type transport system ATP-binding protein